MVRIFSSLSGSISAAPFTRQGEVGPTLPCNYPPLLPWWCLAAHSSWSPQAALTPTALNVQSFFFFCNYPIFCNQPSSRPHGLPSGLAQAGDSLSAAPCLPPHSCSGVTATNPSLPPHLQLSSGQREEPCWKGSRLLCHPPARGLNAAVLASLSLLALIGFDEKYIWYITWHVTGTNKKPHSTFTSSSWFCIS